MGLARDRSCMGNHVTVESEDSQGCEAAMAYAPLHAATGAEPAFYRNRKLCRNVGRTGVAQP
jgi:hypothetical protein